MKKIKYYFVAVVFAWTVSCKDGSDFLDPEAVTGNTLEEVFSQANLTMRFLTDIYGRIVAVLPQGGNNGSRWAGIEALLDCATDNAVYNSGVSAVSTFNEGSWSEVSLPGFVSDQWTNGWSAVRACNMFLKYIDNVPVNMEYGFDDELRAIRKGECFFLKAFFCSEMFKMFGGLPLEDRVLDISEKMDYPRDNVDKTVEYIVDLCDQAAALLPTEHPAYDYGRATKGAALALKARVLLYAASPLWNNPAKPDDSPFRGKYDEGKWRVAAEAAKEVMDLNVYSLHPNIADLFTTRMNSELIFSRMNQTGIYTTFLAIPVPLCPNRGVEGNDARWQATYNLLKEYEILKDGQAYLIDDENPLPLSIYDPQNPFADRDPRFYRDFMYNGYRYRGQAVRIGDFDEERYEPLHNPKTPGLTPTYTICVKFADVTVLITGAANPSQASARTNQNYTYFRYAEVLLNYAEAMNEAFGPDVDGLSNGISARRAVNMIRERAKFPAKNTDRGDDIFNYLSDQGYSGERMPDIAPGLLKDEFRKVLRRERRIELAFEEHRFWDVRRWKIPAEEMTEIKGQLPVWGEDGVRYEIRTIDNRMFDAKKMYRMPIPQAQININKNLVQNPGWTDSPESSE